MAYNSKKHYSTSQLFNFEKDSYLERTSRPIYAAAFLLPFIIFYEIGTMVINTSLLSQYWQGRVVAFSWLQSSLRYLGFSSKFAWIAAPLAVILILLSLQLTSRKQWYFRFRDICPMAVECVLLAIPLIVLSCFLNSSSAVQEPLPASGYQNQIISSCQVSQAQAEQPRAGRREALLANIVTGIGAGIYEELIFRLILICLFMIFFQDILQLSHNSAIVISVILSAVLFSAHHHVIFINGRLVQSSAFNFTEFGFRTAAGIYFAALFAVRGFGITAGTHAFYDIMAASINAFFLE